MTVRHTLPRALGALALALAATACSKPEFPAQEQFGNTPRLPAPKQFLFPPMGLATPIGWKGNEAPSVPQGFAIQAFARDLANPRSVLGLPNGDVIVVESGDPGLAPTLRPKDIVFALTIGAVHGKTKPGNRVLLLRDSNDDGVADQRYVLADKLFSPFGVAVVDNTLYVAATDAILAYPFTPGQTRVSGPARVLAELPGGPIDHHWTKSLVASPDGTKLYVGVGSNSNIVENGLEAEKDRARIFEVDRATGAMRPFATGLRNPNGLTFRPGTNDLWAVVNERDEIGNNLVPDYMTHVKPGAFYGWPWSWYGQHVDIRVQPQRPDMVARATPPDYALGPHVAALGLAFADGPGFPAPWRGGAFVGEHGSWDRTQLNGYQVAFIRFADGKPVGRPEPFVTGFLTPDQKSTHGRPVGLGFDAKGALLVADDVGNAVWRIRPR
ncbi:MULTISPECIES: sorbosone dehydrogenase family protein [unclassified Novosphingobium]|uniref:PQQ-dependent sugar dehydrogenase n=1 Tax=unclassified Novosphingobium TaxID=2644732 RepID=UPI00146B596C|nr:MULTISPECIES: sorbosone dehydrogenase family protein [unclassified Novosphingobium]NMN03071.1 glucose/arabinose dehydrogenase [Novosphingobium sp. SG919]NMN86941.1 glucose/arabinose dehydrogenase [Novosphingobium sp. SG916]